MPNMLTNRITFSISAVGLPLSISEMKVMLKPVNSEMYACVYPSSLLLALIACPNVFESVIFIFYPILPYGVFSIFLQKLCRSANFYAYIIIFAVRLCQE